MKVKFTPAMMARRCLATALMGADFLKYKGSAPELHAKLAEVLKKLGAPASE